MSTKERRENIIGIFKTNSAPVTGTELSEQFHVSRQIIVQDINWLRREGYEIISTTRGYLLQGTPSLQKVIWVQHTDEQIEDELSTILDCGGTVLDVSVYHDIYGLLKAPLYIASKANIADFLESLENRSASPLKNLTGDVHGHTIEFPDIHTWNMILRALKEKGYLLPVERIPQF